MKRVSFALAVLAIVSLVAGLTGCAAPQAQAPQTIKLGFIFPLTGTQPGQAQSSRNAAEMAVNEINDSGGVEVALKKYKIEMIVADSQGTEAGAIAAAMKLTGQDNVLAILHADTGQIAIPASNVAENTHTPYLAPATTTDEVTIDAQTNKPKKYVFRGTYTSSFEGSALAQFALANLGAKTAAVLYASDQAFNRGVAQVFKQAFEQGPLEPVVMTGIDNAPVAVPGGGGFTAGETFNGQVVAFEGYTTGAKDFTTQLDKIKAAAPDVLLLPNYLIEVPAQVKAIKAAGIKATLLGTDSWAYNAMLKDCGSDCDGSYVVTDFRPEIPNKAAEKFIADYTAKYGAAPEAIPALTYDGVYVLAAALQRGAKVDREAMRDGMTRVSSGVESGMPAVTGAIKFAAGTGDPDKAANIMEIKAGKFVYIGNVNP